jgi:hypothetical protein
MERDGSRLAVTDDDEAGRLPHEPTRAEIREACERIRAGWSPRMLRVRAGITLCRLQSPVCPFTAEGRPLLIE